MTARVALLFATTNPGKVAELRTLVGDLLDIRTLADFPNAVEPLEDGETFERNASKKAIEYALATGLPALADDSGLCVDALGGRPGVHSARYVPGSDADRTRKILLALEAVPPDRRGAQFQCALCMALPSGKWIVEVGRCEGTIALAPRGTNGFGYDPIFQVIGRPETMAELTRAEKSSLSHRAKAFEKMRPHLTGLASGRLR